MFTDLVYRLLVTITRNHIEKRETEKRTVFYFYDELHATLLLAFVGGFTGAYGYIKCDGLFTSSVTGNLIAACASVFALYGVVARAFVSLGFLFGGFVGFFVAAKLKRGEEWSAKPISILLYGMEVLLFFVAFAVEVNYDQDISNGSRKLSDWRLILIATILGGSMGMHNAAAKESIPNVPSTTVMSMAVVNESMAIAQLLATFLADKLLVRFSPKWKEIDDAEHARMHERFTDAVETFIIITRPLMSFCVGSLVGAGLASRASYYGILFAAFLIATIAIDIWFAIIVEGKEVEDASLDNYAENSSVKLSVTTDVSHAVV